MGLDYHSLELLRLHHPAWRLLRSDHAALMAGFMHRVFILPNVRSISATVLAEALEDELYALRQVLGEDAFPRSSHAYLNEWAESDKGWLRKFYKAGTDEAQFDVTPAAEKAIAWLMQLGERQFVGTESRLLTLFDLLKQMSEGTESDPEKRMEDLRRKRAEIDREMERIESGDIPLLDDTAIKDRFQQFMQGARELLADFREVEQNFRQLDRRVRERIALWEGSKGALLEDIMGARDAIADSDQGKSFRAFWDFLLSSRRQDELTDLLERVLNLPAVSALTPDLRTRRIHYDWLEAGEHTQRTVAALSQQLRRFLDDKTWLENRRIMEILHGIEAKVLTLRDHPPGGTWMSVDATHVGIDLVMERPLFTPSLKADLRLVDLDVADEEIGIDALYDQVVVDKNGLLRIMRQALQDKDQVCLHELIEAHPLQQGLAELLAYWQLGHDHFRVQVSEDIRDTLEWVVTMGEAKGSRRHARIPRLILLR